MMLPGWLDDVAVEVGEVPAALPGESASGVLWSATRRRFRLEVPGVARFLAADGSSLTVCPAPGADEAAVARFARTTPLAALCYQRGLTVLHAAVAVRDGRAVALAGASAAGKSTLLAALVRRGWGMLGDDLAPLGRIGDDQPIVHPTFPELVLWPDAAARLPQLGGSDGIGAELRPLGPAPAPSGGPQTFAVETLAVPTPLALTDIWWLSAENGSELEFEEVERVDSFDGLGSLAYNGRIAHALLDRVQYMRTAAAVASTVRMRRVHRPRGRWTLAQIADAVDSGERQR
jgi:hypothetical protein